MARKYCVIALMQDNTFMANYFHECKYCGSLKNRDDIYRIDAKQSMQEIEYFCGTVLKIEITGRERLMWMRQCSGRLELGLEHYIKMSDI